MIAEHWNSSQLRYIVFLIDSRIDEHDGTVYSSKDDAIEFAKRSITEKYCTQAIVGCFVLDIHSEYQNISKIKMIGYRGSKKKVEQLCLFD